MKKKQIAVKVSSTAQTKFQTELTMESYEFHAGIWVQTNEVSLFWKSLHDLSESFPRKHVYQNRVVNIYV